MRHYFSFRRKGETRPRLKTVVLGGIGQVFSSEQLAKLIVSRACTLLSCERNQLVLVEPETQIQILAARQERVTLGSPEWCALQWNIDRLTRGYVV